MACWGRTPILRKGLGDVPQFWEGILGDMLWFWEGVLRGCTLILGEGPGGCTLILGGGPRGHALVLGGVLRARTLILGRGPGGHALVLGGGAGWGVQLWTDHCVVAGELTGFCRRWRMLGGGWSRNGILGDVSWGRSVSREAEASVHGVWCVVVVKGGLSFVVASAGRTREMGGGGRKLCARGRAREL